MAAQADLRSEQSEIVNRKPKIGSGDWFEQVLGPARVRLQAQEGEVERERAGVFQFEAEPGVAQLVLAFVEDEGLRFGRRGFGGRVDAARPDVGGVEPGMGKAARVAGDDRPAVFQEERRVVQPEGEAGVALLQEERAQCGLGR
jgi:hypothetical protein